MGTVTGIGWTDHTFNAWIGCTEAGPGCDSCYARELDARHQWGVPGPLRVKGHPPHWGVGAPRYRTSAATWSNPFKWNEAARLAGQPAKVFCNSLADVFDKEIEPAWRVDLFDVWRRTPWLRWQPVTKRASLIRRFLPSDWEGGYPNVGLVVTTVNQQEWDRDAPRLLSIPSRWHGFSLEPQIGPIDVRPILSRHRGSVWLITGGEFVQGRPGQPRYKPPRPYDIRWVDKLVHDTAQMPNVKVYVKQTGAVPVGLPAPADGMGKDPADWPSWMRVQDFVPELLT